MNSFHKILGFALVGSAVMAATSDASASFIDVGVQAGVAGRSLAGTDYKTAFNLQAHADLALIPPILMVGAYINGIPFGGAMHPKPADGVTTTNDDTVHFRSFGARAKLKIPIPGIFTPYFIGGVGLVNADFPDITLSRCLPGVGCASQTVPNANKWFVEFVLGAGAMIKIAGPLHLTLEGAWRPTTGYKNEDYEKAIQNEDQSAPSPSRNGYAWTALGGLALSL
jgi:opacity protein-like surface antigen